MEFLIYDHECPQSTFWDAIPWMSVVLSLYITTKFLIKLMDSSFESYVEDTKVATAYLQDTNHALETERDELIAKVDSLEREREHMDEVVKALVDKFVKSGHPLTKVD